VNLERDASGSILRFTAEGAENAEEDKGKKKEQREIFSSSQQSAPEHPCESPDPVPHDFMDEVDLMDYMDEASARRQQHLPGLN